MKNQTYAELTRILKPAKPKRLYFRKFIYADVVLDYFGTVSRLHRYTGISRTVIYSAIERGYFDDLHVHRIEYSSHGKLKGELYGDEEERKAAHDYQARSHKATMQHYYKRKAKVMNNLHDYDLGEMTQREVNTFIRENGIF